MKTCTYISDYHKSDLMKCQSDCCLTPSEQFLYARLETGRIMWLGMEGGGRPHRFPHNNFSSVYQ